MTSSPAPPPNDSGVTLVEVMIVLAIIGLVLVLAAPNFRGPSRTVEFRTLTYDLANRLKAARAAAISSGRPVVVAFDMPRRWYQLEGAAEPVRLPRDVSISLTSARELSRAAGTGTLRFYADGSASGGRVTLARDAERAAVAVDWLTGAVEVEAVP